MNYTKLSIVAIAAAASIAVGCGGPTVETNVNVNTSNATVVNAVNANGANTTSGLGEATPTPVATTNNAPTLSPVYKAYCAAVVDKNEAAIRNSYSKDTLAFFEKEMKADGIKTLSEYLSGDGVTKESCQVTNEKIDGNSAVARIQSAGYPRGIDIIFLKEGGEWKLTNRSPEVNMSTKAAVPPTSAAPAANKSAANTAKK